MKRCVLRFVAKMKQCMCNRLGKEVVCAGGNSKEHNYAKSYKSVAIRCKDSIPDARGNYSPCKLKEKTLRVAQVEVSSQTRDEKTAF